MAIKKHSLLIAGHPSSVSLEREFWEALQEIALRRNSSVATLISEIDQERQGNLSSAIRVWILQYYRSSHGT